MNISQIREYLGSEPRNSKYAKKMKKYNVHSPYVPNGEDEQKNIPERLQTAWSFCFARCSELLRVLRANHEKRESEGYPGS